MRIEKILGQEFDEYHPQKDLSGIPLHFRLQDNLSDIKRNLGEVNDLLIRQMDLKGANGVRVAIVGIDGLINTERAQHFIIHVMAIDLSLVDNGSEDRHQRIFDTIFNSRISMLDAKISENMGDLYTNLMSGHVLVLLDQVRAFMYFDCKGWQMRGISEPTVEKSLRGPKDCFVETIRVNTATLRRRIKDPRLRFDAHVVGRIARTDIFVAYIEGITNPKYVEIANNRLERIDVDGIANTGELIQYMEDKHFTIFPRVFSTERPDKVSAALLEGQVAIMMDGSPFVILAPFYLTGVFQSVDDYYNPPLFSTLKRMLRYLAFIVIILAPAFYVAVSTFHQEMIPTAFLVIMMSQRESNPFSTFFEMLLIYLLFEIMREASLRKPDAVGNSMSIVGSLIIGQTIVEAGLVSYAAIIIGSIMTLLTYVLGETTISTANRILTLIFMVVSAWLGFYGLTIGIIIFLIHISSLTTFEEPYMTSMSPFSLKSQEDQIVKLPSRLMKFRPLVYHSRNKTRKNLGNERGVRSNDN